MWEEGSRQREGATGFRQVALRSAEPLEGVEASVWRSLEHMWRNVCFSRL